MSVPTGLKVDEVTIEQVMDISEEFLRRVEEKYDFFTPGQELIIKSFYESMEDDILEFAKKGFLKSFKNFNTSELFKFVMKLIPRAELMSGLSGQERKDLIINTLIVIIEKHLPISDGIKTYLVAILKAILPEIIDELVALSKKINKSSFFKKLKKKLCCCC